MVEVAAVVVPEGGGQRRAPSVRICMAAREPHDRVDDEGAPVARLVEAAEPHLPGLDDLVRVVLDLDHERRPRNLAMSPPKREPSMAWLICWSSW